MNLDDKSEAIARQSLSLLLGGPFHQDDWTGIDWDLFCSIARKNLILVRSFEALEKRGIPLPEPFRNEVQGEKRRIQTVIDLVKKTGRLCEANDIPFILTTALQHSPDMGGDIDLLVSNDSRLLDSLLPREFQAKPLPRNLFNLFSTESSFSIPPPSPSIEIHHGRLGLTGEHRLFTTLLFKNARVASFQGADIPIPSDEDHLLLQTIQRLYGRFYFRISDLVCPITLIRNKKLDWDYLFGTASRTGLLEGWRFYLSCLNKIYHDLFGQSLMPPAVQKSIVEIEKEGFVFKNAYYRYPLLPVTGRLYWKKWRADLLSGRLASVARLCLLPSVAGSFLFRNFRGNRSRYFQNS